MRKRGRPAGLTKEIPNTRLEKQGGAGPFRPMTRSRGCPLHEAESLVPLYKARPPPAATRHPDRSLPPVLQAGRMLAVVYQFEWPVPAQTHTTIS